MALVRQNLQVVVVADDPIEAGMLALDLVQAGLAAQAVRDDVAAQGQLVDLAKARPDAAIVVVAAHRELSQAIELTRNLQTATPRPAIVAVVLRSQRDAAEKLVAEIGWAGFAVRPVNADELVGLVLGAMPQVQATTAEILRMGSLADESLASVLGSLIDRVARPGGGRSATVYVDSHGRQGVVSILEGELVHAGCDGDSGRHVLERLCAWRSGDFRVEPGGWSAAPTLTGSSLGLLAVAQEYARRVDEARLNLPYADCICTVRWERVRPLPVVAEAMFRRIASGLVLAEALAGEGDDELEAFAALETRIKRGAVVPQIDTAPPIAPSSADPRSSGSFGSALGGPGSALGGQRLGPGGGNGGAPLRSSGLQASSRQSSAIAPYRASSAFSAVPMTLVDAPQVPVRRHSHPTTNLYRVGDDARMAADVRAETVGIEMPPSQSQREGQGQRGQPTHRSQEIQREGTAGDRPPALPPRRPQSSYGPPSVPGSTPAVPGARKGLVTGWFGVGVGEDGNGGDGGEAPALRARHHPSSVRVTDLSRGGQGLRAEGDGDRLAARPYSWMPTQRPEPMEEDPDAEPIVVPPVPRARWQWLMAAGALAVLVVVLVWPVEPEAPMAEAVAASPAARAYRRATDLIDQGESREAMAILENLVQGSGFEPEALLQLGVLEAQAGAFDRARSHLDQYIGHPQARHRSRAQRLHRHLFGDGSEAAAGAATHGGT